MNDIIRRIKSKPALVIGFVRSLLILGVSFGAGLTAEQSGAILAVVSMGLSFLTDATVPSAPPDPPTA